MTERSGQGNDTSIDFHIKITDMLMDNFVPKIVDNEVGERLLRRAVSTIAEDIVKLAEDCYGVNQ